jgi:hypothetical protein
MGVLLGYTMPDAEKKVAEGDEYGGLQPLSTKWALIGSGALVLAFTFVIVIGLKDKAILSAISVGTFVSIGRVYWNFRKSAWFAVCMGAFWIIHLAVISAIDLPPTKFMLYPIIVADFMLTLWVFWLVKSRFEVGPD